MDKETFASGNTNRLSRRQIAWLVANEIPDGSYVNLGIGIPTLCADHMPEEKEILLHSENGVLGFGPRPDEGEEDADLVNAGKQPITMLKGGSYFVHSDAFGMIKLLILKPIKVGMFLLIKITKHIKKNVSHPGEPLLAETIKQPKNLLKN